MTDLNIEQLKRYYQTFKPSFLSVQDHSRTTNAFTELPVKDEQDFLNKCNQYEHCSLYACFNKLKGKRNADNVTEVDWVFLDADDETTLNHLLEELEKHEIKISIMTRTGPIGHQLFIKIPKITITNKNPKEETEIREETKKTIKAFINNLNRKGLLEQDLIDTKCSDLSRLCRVFGSINNKPKYEQKINCEIKSEQAITKEQENKNFEAIKKLAQETLAYYGKHGYEDFDSPECELLESALNNNLKLDKQDTSFNDTFGKNACIYAINKLDEKKAVKQCSDLFERKNHARSKALTWIKKAVDKKMTVNCGELMKNVSEHYPEIFKEKCYKCRLKNTNKIAYINEPCMPYHEVKQKYPFTKKFYINNETTFKGLLTCTNDNKETFVLLKQYVKNKADTETEITMENLDDRKTVWYGEKLVDKRYTHLLNQDFCVPLHTYNFKENGLQYLVRSEKKLPTGLLKLSGMLVEVHDKKKEHNYSLTSITQHEIFVYDHEELVKKPKSMQELTHLNTRDLVLDIYAQLEYFETITFEQPEWLQNFIAVMILTGSQPNYHLHFLIIGPPNSGKSELLKGLKRKTFDSYHDASNYTIKGLIPSFSVKDAPKKGALLEANMFVLLDELITKMEEAKGITVNDFKKMNNLLLNDESSVGSGNGKLEETMNAKIVCTNNTLKDKSEEETVQSIEASVLSRFLFIIIPDSMHDWIKNMHEHKISNYQPKTSITQFMGILQYMQGIQVKPTSEQLKRYDEEITKITRHAPKYMQEYVSDGSRYKIHHVYKILEGITKKRMLDTHTDDPTVSEEDLQNALFLNKKIVTDWHCQKTMPVLDKLNTKQHRILDKIRNQNSMPDLIIELEKENYDLTDLKFLVENGIVRVSEDVISLNQEVFSVEIDWEMVEIKK